MSATTGNVRARGNRLSILEALRRILLEPVDPEDPASLDRALVELVVGPVARLGRLYFRAEVGGLERVPDGPALIVGNHNAGITFLEPFMMGAAYYQARGYDDPLFFLAHDAMVDLPVLRGMLCRFGAVRASHQSADRVFAHGGKLVVYPGGNREAFRRFTDRHRIDLAGRTGFLKLALRSGVPLLPVVQIGGHETFLVLHPGEGLARRLKLNTLMRSDTCAVFLGLPWGLFVGPMFHLPLPSKSVIRFGEPIDPQTLGYGPEDAGNPDALRELYERVSGQMQGLMDALAGERRYPILG